MFFLSWWSYGLTMMDSLLWEIGNYCFKPDVFLMTWCLFLVLLHQGKTHDLWYKVTTIIVHPCTHVFPVISSILWIIHLHWISKFACCCKDQEKEAIHQYLNAPVIVLYCDSLSYIKQSFNWDWQLINIIFVYFWQWIQMLCAQVRS